MTIKNQPKIIEKNSKKIARIWAIANKAGISKENIYALVESVTGSDSISSLTGEELDSVIKQLHRLHPECRMATFPQKQYIHYLQNEVGKKYNADQLLKQITETPVEKMSFEEAGKVITAFKNTLGKTKA